MPLSYQRDTPPEPVGLIADRRLCLAGDQKTVVEEGDPRAAFLLVAEGSVIPTIDASALGLSVVGGRIVQGASVGDAPAPATEIPAVSVAPSAPAPKVKAKGKAKGGE